MAAPGILAAAGSLLVALTSSSDVELSARTVRLSDVASVQGAGVAPVGSVAIASVASLGDVARVSRAELAELIRRAVPGATVSGHQDGVITFHIPAAPAPTPQEPLEASAKVKRGDRLVLRSNYGAVSIQREVVALQEAGPRARKLFVRSADGDVFAAPLEQGGSR